MPCSARVLMSFNRFESDLASDCGAYGEWGVAVGLGEAEVRCIVARNSIYRVLILLPSFPQQTSPQIPGYLAGLSSTDLTQYLADPFPTKGREISKTVSGDSPPQVPTEYASLHFPCHTI